MNEILELLVNNIWIVAIVVTVICLICAKVFWKTMGTVAKVILFLIALGFLAVALGFTTSAELKETVLGLFDNAKNFSSNDYKDAVNDNYTGEKFWD